MNPAANYDHCPIASDLQVRVAKSAKRDGITEQALVQKALIYYLECEHRTLFQTSISSALVQGAFHGGLPVTQLKQHGDFGLGTFNGLNGEMIMLDGECFQATEKGSTREAEDNWLVPFGVVTHLEPLEKRKLPDIVSISALIESLDRLRTSDNYTLAIRIDGLFNHLRLRTASTAKPGEDLVTATQHQSEFSLANIVGTLVGFWTPAYASTFNVPGYHFHFLSGDRKAAGHLLDVKATDLSIQLQEERRLLVSMPDSDEFRTADLTGDPSADLARAEN